MTTTGYSSYEPATVVSSFANPAVGWAPAQVTSMPWRSRSPWVCDTVTVTSRVSTRSSAPLTRWSRLTILLALNATVASAAGAGLGATVVSRAIPINAMRAPTRCRAITASGDVGAAR